MRRTKCPSITKSIGFAVIFSALFVLPAAVICQTAATQEQAAAFKQSLAKNAAGLKKYQWVETTTISLKGEVKSTKQNSCYYGADGKVQKTPIPGAAAPAQPVQSGGRGGRLKQRVIANKKEEMSDHMKKAFALVGKYVPPNPDLIKYSKETNNIKVEPVAPNKTIRLGFPDFVKKGDLLSATLDLVSNSIVDVNIATYLDSEKDKVTVSVVFSKLGDGTNYAGKTTLHAEAKKIAVVVENGGYRK